MLKKIQILNAKLPSFQSTLMENVPGKKKQTLGKFIEKYYILLFFMLILSLTFALKL